MSIDETIAELRKLLADWNAERDGCPEIRTYGKLCDAAVNALPGLLDEIERLRAALLGSIKDTRQLERIEHLEAEAERLRAAVRDFEAVHLDMDAELKADAERIKELEAQLERVQGSHDAALERLKRDEAADLHITERIAQLKATLRDLIAGGSMDEKDILLAQAALEGK